MKSVWIHPEAEAELVESIRFYEGKRSGLGLEFEQVVRETVETLRSFPSRHAKMRDGSRRVLTDRFPFFIIYIERAEEILILAFAHTSRRPEYWTKRR